MRTVVALLIGVVIGGLAVQYTEPYFESGGMRMMKAAQCDAVVRISFDGTNVHAYPDKVCLAKDRNLTWEIDDDRAVVEIDFNKKGKTGPFPEDPQNTHSNGGRGKYKRKANDAKLKIDSNPAKDLGKWDYYVRYTPFGATDPIVIDPAVCIRK